MNILKWLRWRFGRKIKLMDSQGACIFVPAVASIEDLVRLGFTKPSIKPDGQPLKFGEWEAQNWPDAILSGPPMDLLKPKTLIESKMIAGIIIGIVIAALIIIVTVAGGWSDT